MAKMSKEYWREKKREQRAAQKEVAKSQSPADTETKWDQHRYPIKAAWDIAVQRAQRAKLYALKFPEHVRPHEEIFQDVDWQYKNEGVPAVTEKDRVTLRKTDADRSPAP